MKTHRDLDVWQKSIDFVIRIYEHLDNFPSIEKYELSSQIRRAVVSIPSNIAEGAARSSDKDFLKFIYYSLGSLSEVETQLIIAKRLKYINDDELFSELENIKHLILGLVKFLKNRINTK
jgi:four helix bundle protein